MYRPRSINVRIAGSGAWLPEHVVTSEELENQLGLCKGWIARRTGVVERRRAFGATASALGAKAARVALARSGFEPNDIDVIIAASAAPQQMLPCTAAFLQRELGAPEGASVCFDVNASCLSFQMALSLSASMIEGGEARAILIVSSEIAGPSLNPKEPESAVLIGDAAAAAVVTRSENGEAKICGSRFATYSSGIELSQVPGAGTLHHPNDPATSPEMNMFHMDGPALFRKSITWLRPFLCGFLSDVGWTPASIQQVIPHQAGRHGLEFLLHCGFSADQVFSNLHDRGNCVAASLPLAIAEAAEQGAIRRGDRILLVGAGAGVSLGATALIF